MKNRNIIILILLVFVIISFYFIFLKSKEDLKSQNKVNITEEKELIFSRINFFLEKENKASINIPDYWEGHYRLKKYNNRVDFVYLEEGIEKDNIFSIEMKKKNDYKGGEDDSVILESENYYYLFLENNNENDNVFYKKMENDVRSLLESFKIS